MVSRKNSLYFWVLVILGIFIFENLLVYKINFYVYNNSCEIYITFYFMYKIFGELFQKLKFIITIKHSSLCILFNIIFCKNKYKLI